MVEGTLLASLLLCPVLAALAICSVRPVDHFLPRPFSLENLSLTSLRFDMQPSLLVYFNRTHGSCLRASAFYDNNLLNLSIICGNQHEQTAKINVSMQIYTSIVYVRHRTTFAESFELYFCDREYQQQGWITINTYPIFLEPDVTRSSLVLFGHSCREQCLYRMDLQVYFESDPKAADATLEAKKGRQTKKDDKSELFFIGLGTMLALVLVLCIGCSFF